MLVRAEIYLVAIEKWRYFWSMSRHNRTFSAKSFVRELSIKLKFFTEIDEFWLNSFLKKISDVEFGSDHNGTANHQPLSVWPAAWCLVHWPKIWSIHKTMQLTYPMVSCMFWGSTLLSIKTSNYKMYPLTPTPTPKIIKNPQLLLICNENFFKNLGCLTEKKYCFLINLKYKLAPQSFLLMAQERKIK